MSPGRIFLVELLVFRLFWFVSGVGIWFLAVRDRSSLRVLLISSVLHFFILRLADPRSLLQHTEWSLFFLVVVAMHLTAAHGDAGNRYLAVAGQWRRQHRVVTFLYVLRSGVKKQKLPSVFVFVLNYSRASKRLSGLTCPIGNRGAQRGS